MLLTLLVLILLVIIGTVVSILMQPSIEAENARCLARAQWEQSTM
jgi:preprotein translocase subunit SecG